jgi:peptidoglycan hydrolase-like protein with peptidoglycan-binding domain
MKSFKQLLNEAAITGKKPDEMALPYSNQLVQHKDVKEIPSGSNRSPEIDRYLKLTGLDNEARFKKKGVGYPWCMAFVYAMFDDFCNKMGLPNPLPKTAGVLSHWSRADSSLKISASEARSNPSLVKPGQIFFLETNRAKSQGHTGIVTSVDTASGTYKTIEGNTNDMLSREGHRVGRNTRKLSSGQLLGFVDYFKGNRNRKFEETVAEVVANAPTDFSPTESEGGLSVEQIKDVQRVLLAAGYDLGTYGPNKDGVDGDFGSKTKEALKDWKSKNGMANDMVLDKDVYSKITSKPAPTDEEEEKEKTTTDEETEEQESESTPSNNILTDSEGNAEVRLQGRFPGKTVRVINQNLSNSDDLVIVKAVIENANYVKNFSDLLNEQNLIRKLRDLKKKQDTKLADKYRGYSSDSPIETGNTKTTNILKSGEEESASTTSSKPEVLITYRKSDNAYLIEPANKEAESEMNLKRGDRVRVGDLDSRSLFPLFKAFAEKKTGDEESTTVKSPIASRETEVQAPNNVPTFSGQPPVPSSTSQTTQKGATIAKKLVADLGLTKEQAAGVVGNLWAESGLIPDRIQGSGTRRGVLPQAGNGGYGWAQYTHPSLKTDLINFAKGKGVDLNTQPLTDEMNYEYLKHWIAKNPNRFSALKSTTDLRGATDYFLKQYERPADQSEVALNKRSGFAERVYSQLA